MANQIEFQLINGRFSVEEAQPILSAMSDAKLHHLARKMTLSAATEEDLKASERRMKQIEEDLRGVLRFLRETARKGGRVDIEATITVKEA